MGFIDDIAESLGLAGVGAESTFRATIMGEKAAYFEKVSAVKSYSPDKIELVLKKGGLKITGDSLTIKKYCAGDLAVCGTIKSVERT